MSLPLDVTPAAQDEIADGHDYYERYRAGAGPEFVEAVQVIFDRITAFPRYGRLVLRDARKAVLVGYPYCVYYREVAGTIVVLSVFHTSRDPSVWQARV